MNKKSAEHWRQILRNAGVSCAVRQAYVWATVPVAPEVDDEWGVIVGIPNYAGDFSGMLYDTEDLCKKAVRIYVRKKRQPSGCEDCESIQVCRIGSSVFYICDLILKNEYLGLKESVVHDGELTDDLTHIACPSWCPGGN